MHTEMERMRHSLRNYVGIGSAMVTHRYDTVSARLRAAAWAPTKFVDSPNTITSKIAVSFSTTFMRALRTLAPTFRARTLSMVSVSRWVSLRACGL
jgi:hypothetical protein